ncbi:MAG: hypothetical protein MSG64_08990 [Pyrinomonadaceae bacterium MAG19_C2-C3]|nr:hypothetical protein [Pyrinomonadaceae bacterium MAG19_C2-C3]
MNTRHDTQIDLLLRDNFAPETFARADSTAIGASARAPVASDDSHLDVDELSALTATTLPEATRAAYLKHLMMCDACRRQASLLALAASSETTTANQSDDTEIQVIPVTTNNIDAPSDFWKSFTPPFNLVPSSVATYTLATLAALVVLTVCIGLFVRLNNQNSSGEIAMQTASTREAITESDDPAMSDQPTGDNASTINAMNANMANANSMTMNGNAASNASGLYAANANSNTAANASQTPNATKQTTTNQIAELPINGRTTDSLMMLSPSSAAPSPQAKSSEGEDVIVTADAPAPPTTTPLPPSSSLPAAPLEPQDSRITQSDDITTFESRQDAARRADDKIAAAQPQKNEAQGFLRRTEPNARASSSDADEKKRTSSPTSSAAPRARSVTSNETPRVIGNRRFTRQAETWIDNSYRTPMRVTNIKRDSEQLCALIKQDASVRHIVEQLAGSIILVINNQAYRVQ